MWKIVLYGINFLYEELLAEGIFFFFLLTIWYFMCIPDMVLTRLQETKPTGISGVIPYLEMPHR